MFEQSLLIDQTETRKAATFAVSLTAQILVAGVLVIAPLLYHDMLPAIRMPVLGPLLAVWRPPQAPVSEPRRTAGSRALVAPRPFEPFVVTHSDYPRAAATVLDDAPVFQSAPAIAALPLGSSALPAFELAPAPSKPAVITRAPETPVRVGGDVQSAKLLKQVVPSYPEPARRLRISGTVHLLGVIAKDGTIQRLQVLSGHPLLRQAALDAVSQWVYRPTVLNGQPVEVEAPIDVIFNLSR
jgi:periplasmic protein TonB